MSDNIEKSNLGGELLNHREEFETRNKDMTKYGDVVPFETAQIDRTKEIHKAKKRLQNYG